MLTVIGTVRSNSWTAFLAIGAAAAALFAGSYFSAGNAAPTPAAAAQRRSAEGPLLVYEENRGQAASKVRFIARGSRYTQFITAEEVVWRLDGADQDYAVYMRFPGAAPAFVRGESSLPGRTNYLKGTDPSKWVTGAEQFSAVRLTGLYPGVSLKLYGSRARPEYDFIVAPGADASVIRLRFAGAQAVEVGSHGELSVRTPAGELIHQSPVAFQPAAQGRTVPVSARFVQVAADEVRFELAQYDSTRELVIDPVYFIRGTRNELGGGGSLDTLTLLGLLTVLVAGLWVGSARRPRNRRLRHAERASRPHGAAGHAHVSARRAD